MMSVRKLESGLIILVLVSLVTSAPAQNTTVTIPSDRIQHSDTNLLCTPPKWTDIALFYLGNFVFHAGTVRSHPGESIRSVIFAMILALLFPTAGVIRGLDAIYGIAAFRKPPLQRASRIGALCMVVRSRDWKPNAGDKVAGVIIPDDAKVDRSYVTPNIAVTSPQPKSSLAFNPEIENSRSGTRMRAANIKIYIAPSGSDDSSIWFYEKGGNIDLRSRRQLHGQCNLPPGYELRFVPRSASQYITFSDNSAKVTLSTSYSFSKALTAIVQVIFASITLYRSRGDQIARYGYAAFGLTVVPYLVMSVVNLFGNLVTPEYPSLFLISSDIMDEASRRPGYLVDGEVGKIETVKPTASESGMKHGSFVSGDNGSLLFNSIENDKELSPGIVISMDEAKQSIFIPSCSTFIADKRPHQEIIRHLGQERSEDQGEVIFDKNLFLGSLLVFATCLAIVGGLSGFHAGKSTTAQRVWTMMWLTFGFVYGFQYGIVSSFFDQALAKVSIWPCEIESKDRCFMFSYVSLFLLLTSPAIGGLVISGQMLQVYGSCIRID